ncbi:hypothetical protein NECID01_0461 [Nematocida sp. AWRm77]|nr:hypothetical protein NECID01_0461 [Nematocida sp. AWRm77]
MQHEKSIAYFNLLKTVIGSGIVSFPSLFAMFGVVPAVCFSAMSAVLTFFGLVMLCECASFYENKKTTFSGALENVWPGISRMFSAVVFVKCFGVSVSYLLIVQTFLLSIFKNIPHVSSLSPGMVIALYGLVVIPLCAMKDLKSLRYTSVVGVIGVYVCICGGVYSLVQVARENALPPTQLFAPVSSGWLAKVGQFVFSFTCHQNIFSVRASLKNPTKRAMKHVISLVLSSALGLYLIFGAVMYKAYGDSIKDNALESFREGPVATGVFIFYIVLLTCSYPLQIHPARDCLCEWASGLFSISEKHGTVLRAASTGLLVAMGILIVFSAVKLSTIQSVIGGTASTLMCNVIPSVCIMKLPRKKSLAEKTFAASLLVYGALAFTGVCVILLN